MRTSRDRSFSLPAAWLALTLIAIALLSGCATTAVSPPILCANSSSPPTIARDPFLCLVSRDSVFSDMEGHQLPRYRAGDRIKLRFSLVNLYSKPVFVAVTPEGGTAQLISLSIASGNRKETVGGDILLDGELQRKFVLLARRSSGGPNLEILPPNEYTIEVDFTIPKDALWAEAGEAVLCFEFSGYILGESSTFQHSTYRHIPFRLFNEPGEKHEPNDGTNGP